MDDYLFQFHVEKSHHVLENTRYLEIYTYSDSMYDTVVEHSLPLDQFDDFLSEKGAFSRPELPDGVTQLAGFRLILQQNASYETFSPSVISLPPDKYSKMITKFRLPYKGIEGSSTVGQFFWTAMDDEAMDILQIIYRKSDVSKKADVRAWELLLSFNASTGVTTAFCKATPKSYIIDNIKHLKESSQQIGHPMLFPMIIFSRYHSARVETTQRNAREGLRKIEEALSLMQIGPLSSTAVENSSDYLDENGLIDFGQINRDLTECHSQALKNGPAVYLRGLDGFEQAMSLFERFGHLDSSPQHTHYKLLSRIDFYRKKLHGQEYYQSATLQRLDAQRSALSISCGQIDNRVSFQIAEAQTKLVHSNKREAVSQKVIAILGTVFLPGAYLSSLFSMTFFNWHPTDTNANGFYVSPLFWIYWAISIPLVIAVVGSYILWDRKLSNKAHKEDEAIEMRMLDMKRNSQNQAVRSGTTVNSRSRSVQRV